MIKCNLFIDSHLNILANTIPMLNIILLNLKTNNRYYTLSYTSLKF